MSKIRKYGCPVKTNIPLSIEKLREVLELFGLQPSQYKQKGHKIRSWEGDRNNVDITISTAMAFGLFKAIVLTGSRATKWGISFDINQDGTVNTNTIEISGDSFGVDNDAKKMAQKLGEAIAEALEASKVSNNPVASGVTPDDIATVAQAWGGKVKAIPVFKDLTKASPEQQQAALIQSQHGGQVPLYEVSLPQSKALNPKGAIFTPKIHIGVDQNGATTILVHEKIKELYPQQIQNLERAAQGVVVVKTQAENSTHEGTAEAQVYVDEEGTIQGADISWDRPEKGQVTVTSQTTGSALDEKRQTHWANQVAQKSLTNGVATF